MFLMIGSIGCSKTNMFLIIGPIECSKTNNMLLIARSIKGSAKKTKVFKIEAQNAILRFGAKHLDGFGNAPSSSRCLR